MACDFRHFREQALPLVVDPAPNATPPTDDARLELERKPANGQEECPGIGFYFDSDNGVAGTVTWTLWVLDARTARWVKAGSGVALANNEEATAKVPLAATCFVQVTAVGGFVASTKLFTRATERKL